MCDRNKLAVIARAEAEKPYNGKWNHCESNIQDIVALFPKWSVEEADGLWCAAFVYHCVTLAGFKIPVHPEESSCSLAGCKAWEEWAQTDSRGCLSASGWRSGSMLIITVLAACVTALSFI